MAGILLLLSILSIVKAVAEATFRQSWGVRLGHSLCYLIGLVLTHRQALSVSKLTIDTQMAERETLSTLVIFVMLDLIISIGVASYHRADTRIGSIYRRDGLVSAAVSLLHGLCTWMPSLILFPALYYLRAHILFSIPGLNYWVVTASCAVLPALLICVAPLIIPVYMGRRIIVSLLGVIVFAVTIGAYIVVPQSQIPDITIAEDSLWPETAQTVLVILLGALVGYVGSRFIRKNPFNQPHQTI